jgi:hypothetical protein
VDIELNKGTSERFKEIFESIIKNAPVRGKLKFTNEEKELIEKLINKK